MTTPRLTSVDYTRQAFITSLVRILNSWNSALNDANARGYPTQLGDIVGGASENTTVEAAALTRSLAREWLQELDKTVNHIVLLANQAALFWPPTPKKGTTTAGVTVGARGNNVEVCGYCHQPVTGGHNDPIRRIDGQPFHGKNCWYTVTRNRT